MDVKHTKYTDFLKDTQFLRWQLMPDETLNGYWLDYIKKHPEQFREIQKAVTYLKREGLNKRTLNKKEKADLLNKIQISIREENKIKQIKIFRYSLVASAVVVLILVGITLFSPYWKNENTPEAELIVGELLTSKDIQLLTSGKAITFQDNVAVALNKEGIAEVTEGDSERKKIEIDKDQSTSLIVPYGKRSMLTLADGSKVWLNSGSVLEFPAQFSGKSREIRLASGEMYIEVSHDKKRPFFVQTDNFNIRVYGTKFNISTYCNSPHSVVLVEGSVGLQSSGKKELYLSPSEQAIYSENGTFSTQKVDVTPFISWKNGYLSFHKTPMDEVLQQIGRYYNLSFDFNQDTRLQKRTCTGKIYLSDNLDNVMTTLSLLTSTKYEKRERKIYITNEPK
ncbi:FecR family protein [Proteiniphilum sp. UBA1028]|jgi:hypothetical protein|uniref:FecR family protein n=1 Tax=Proteiniphilum sp. UBA1028 TaxID=1947251 RepID=UPI0025CF574A|nr:FecR family protein [Proteiniphilum sp. UBA1028]